MADQTRREKPIPTPDFETYGMERPLVAASVQDGVVCVKWGDGQEGRFHFIWLRDNCACEACIDFNSHERVYSILDIPEDVRPLAVSVSAEGGLRVEWSDGDHISHFHPGWLRHFDYANGRRPVESWELKTWDRSLELNLPLFSAEAVLNDESAHYDFLLSIRCYGIAIITGVPKDSLTFERLANRIGLVRDMNWGKIFEIIAKPEGEYVANRSYGLDAHSDAATREYMPGLQIFQCVENTSEGGESFWVDGLHIADLMRKQHPEAWETLTTESWEHANRAKGSHYRWTAPVVTLDHREHILAVRDTTWLREPLCVDFDSVPRLYAAYRVFSMLKAERNNQVERKLVEGDMAFIDNRRVLHGRRSFDPASGSRHIRTCYSEREELLSSIRIIERARRRKI